MIEFNSVGTVVAFFVGCFIGTVVYKLFLQQKFLVLFKPKSVKVKFITNVFQVGVSATDPTKVILHFNSDFFPRGVVVDAADWVQYGVPNKGEVFITTNGVGYFLMVQGQSKALYLSPAQ